MSDQIIFYEDSDFYLAYEEQLGRRFIHCRATRFNKGILRRGAEVLSDLKWESSQEGHDFLYCYTQNGKFVRMMGGEFLREIEYDEEIYEVYQWVTL